MELELFIIVCSLDSSLGLGSSWFGLEGVSEHRVLLGWFWSSLGIDGRLLRFLVYPIFLYVTNLLTNIVYLSD